MGLRSRTFTKDERAELLRSTPNPPTGNLFILYKLSHYCPPLGRKWSLFPQQINQDNRDLEDFLRQDQFLEGLDYSTLEVVNSPISLPKITREPRWFVPVHSSKNVRGVIDSLVPGEFVSDSVRRMTTTWTKTTTTRARPNLVASLLCQHYPVMFSLTCPSLPHIP